MSNTDDLNNRKDHREIGQELDLFYIDEKVGSGLAMWLPKGALVRYLLSQYMTDLEMSNGYKHVITPHIAKLDLYKTSGHWEHYQNDMFPPMKRGNEEFVLRPMNCPHHIQMFSSKPRSYRELPMRIAEFGTLYRWENSGELFGLMRVRAMTLNDAHIFCTSEQMEEEFIKVIKLIDKVYKDLKVKNYWYRLSLPDFSEKKKYVDNPKMWEDSIQAIRNALDKAGLEYKEGLGDAAFYGPKLDVQIPNALGKDETVSTVQVDFYLPEKFKLQYIGEDGEKHPIVMIHRGIISTLERMVAFLIEQYQGAFPMWLSPVQVMIVPIADKHNEHCKKLLEQLKDSGFRAEIDDRSEKMQAKIRDAQLQKIPYMLVVGDREIEEGKVAVRKRSGEDLGGMKVEEFLELVGEEVRGKV